MFNISIYVLGVLYRQFKVFLKIGISSAFGKKEGEREGASVNRSGKLPRNCRSGKLPRNCYFNVSSAFERRRTLTFTFGERVWTRVRWKKFLQLAVLVTQRFANTVLFQDDASSGKERNAEE